MLAPPISTVGTMIKTIPATKRDCGLMRLLPCGLPSLSMVPPSEIACICQDLFTEIPTSVLLGNPYLAGRIGIRNR